MISHFYRKPSWMYALHRLGRENIEHSDEDPPINDFLTEAEVLRLFRGFEIVERAREHYRALPICRSGVKAALYRYGFKPVYNLLPGMIARPLAYKFSITAIKT